MTLIKTLFISTFMIGSAFAGDGEQTQQRDFEWERETQTKTHSEKVKGLATALSRPSAIARSEAEAELNAEEVGQACLNAGGEVSLSGPKTFAYRSHTPRRNTANRWFRSRTTITVTCQDYDDTFGTSLEATDSPSRVNGPRITHRRVGHRR